MTTYGTLRPNVSTGWTSLGRLSSSRLCIYSNGNRISRRNRKRHKADRTGKRRLRPSAAMPRVANALISPRIFPSCAANKRKFRLIIRIIDRGGRLGERCERDRVFDHDGTSAGGDAMTVQRRQIA